MKTRSWLVLLTTSLLTCEFGVASAAPPAASTNTVRVAAAQAARRIIDFRSSPAKALAGVEQNLSEIERIIARAGDAKCDALALPEDTMGLLNWLGANETLASEVLPKAVKRMIERLGSAAARYRMYLVVCSDHIENDAGIYNTAFLLGRDGNEIGRHHKVCPTWSESGERQRGTTFPVFPTPDLGTAGLLICYDLVVPETARCLALQGADIIFFPTMGGAAMGDEDIGVQALRVRAAENFIWLVVAHREGGAMIISPQGKIVAQADAPDGLAIADINPHGQREGGDALNSQRDMRARLFRERNSEAFRILTEPNPPVLDKAPIGLTRQEAGRFMARALSVGEEEFKEASQLQQLGKTEAAITSFERLRNVYPDTWIDRVSQQRLAKLQSARPKADAASSGLAAKYPGDRGIENDPDVFFADNFESGDLKKWDQQRGGVIMAEDAPNAGR
jgi:predicted amidohydrolase